MIPIFSAIEHKKEKWRGFVYGSYLERANRNGHVLYHIWENNSGEGKLHALDKEDLRVLKTANTTAHELLGRNVTIEQVNSSPEEVIRNALVIAVKYPPRPLPGTMFSTLNEEDLAIQVKTPDENVQQWFPLTAVKVLDDPDMPRVNAKRVIF
jgi:hypothetical protein